MTSGLWPEGLAGQLTWTGTMRGSGFSSRLWFELQALEPEGKTCSSCPSPRALEPFSFFPYPSLAKSRLNGASHASPLSSPCLCRARRGTGQELWAGHLYSISIFDNAYIARMLKMIHYFICIQ